MKILVKLLPLYFFCLFSILFFSASTQGQTNNKLSDTENGGFLEISAGIIALNSRFIDGPKNIGLIADARFSYYWNNFFLEDEGIKGLGIPGIGYNFYNRDSWMFDVFFTETHPAILWKDGGYLENGIINEQDGLTGITPRRSDDRISLRATHIIDDTTALRILIAPMPSIYSIANNSPYLAAWYGKTWQHQNINFHTTLNAQYYNSHTLDYYYGIAGQDVSDKFEAYKACSGVLLSAEFGTTYPLASGWLLESSVKLTRLPDSIYQSPLINTRLETHAQISLTYVLF